MSSRFNAKVIEDLSGHLSFIGVKVVSREYHSSGIRPTRGWGVANMLIFVDRLGAVKVADRNIDLVEFWHSNVGQYSGTEDFPSPVPDYYWCNFVVLAKIDGLEDRLKAKLEVVRRGPLSETVDFVWEGNELAQMLNNDSDLNITLSQLKDELMRLDVKPDKKHQCVRIRHMEHYHRHYYYPAAAFPSAQAFETCDRIARHVRKITGAR